MLSKEWFSIMSTTMCSIWGVVGVPSGRVGNGSAPGPSCEVARATGRAHAGRRPAPAARPSAAPPPALSSVRRERGTATAAILRLSRQRRGELEQRGFVTAAAGELDAEREPLAHPSRDADHRPGGLAERPHGGKQRTALAGLIAVQRRRDVERRRREQRGQALILHRALELVDQHAARLLGAQVVERRDRAAELEPL